MATWLTVTAPATTKAVVSRVDLVVMWFSLLNVVAQYLWRSGRFTKERVLFETAPDAGYRGRVKLKQTAKQHRTNVR